MIQRILYFFVCQLLFLGVQAQLTLSGTVVSADTHFPVVSANVYLNNSTVGTITNENGQFALLRFPNGRFDLVVSCIGYETYHITLQSNQLPEKISVLLKPTTRELQEVIVEAYDKNGWRKWGKTFMDNFMGTSANVRDCKLVNPGDVHFRYSEKRQMLIATGADLLIIENKALGYILKYNLTRFEYRTASQEFFINGYALFENMTPRNAKQEANWVQNRKDAYYGSMMHFMRSLFQNKIKEQKFEVKQILQLTNAQYMYFRKRYAYYLNNKDKLVTPFAENDPNDPINQDLIPKDSIGIYTAVFNTQKNQRIVVDSLLTGDDLAYRIDSVTMGLYFTGRLQIVCTDKENPREFRPYLPRDLAFRPALSEAYLVNRKPLAVLGNGSFFDGGDLMIAGFWAWSEKMCNKLPYDYWP